MLSALAQSAGSLPNALGIYPTTRALTNTLVLSGTNWALPERPRPLRNSLETYGNAWALREALGSYPTPWTLTKDMDPYTTAWTVSERPGNFGYAFTESLELYPTPWALKKSLGPYPSN
jgi:hypothetical protein